jgi:hypothetical protein
LENGAASLVANKICIVSPSTVADAASVEKRPRPKKNQKPIAKRRA